MSLLKKLDKKHRNILNQWLVILSISVFVVVFLMLFRPFGLQNSDLQNIEFLLIGNGLVTFFALIINVMVISNLFKSFFNKDNWTFWKQLIWMFWNVFSVGLLNFVYIKWVGNDWDFRLNEILIFILISFAIAIIPVSILSLINYNRVLKQNLKDAIHINEHLNQSKHIRMEDEEIILLHSENGNQKIELKVETLLYIESNGNYLSIYHLVDKKVEKTVIRNTIKNAEEQLNGVSAMMRVHRAFIVNLHQIENVKGNSQGYILSLRNTEEKVSVSRTYLEKFKSKMDL